MKALALTLGLLGISLVTFSAHAGDGLNKIDCQSASGKTLVHVYQTDGGESAFRFTLRNADDKGSTEYGYVNQMARLNSGGDNDPADPIFHNQIKGAIVSIMTKSVVSINAVTIDAKHQDEQPATLNSVEGTLSKTGPYNNSVTKFRAVLEGRDPRVTSGYKWLEPIKVTCTMTYSL